MMKKRIRNFLCMFATTSLLTGIMLIDPIGSSSAAEVDKLAYADDGERAEFAASSATAMVSGLIPNDPSAGKENVKTFNQVLKQAAANGTAELIVPQGTYYLNAEHGFITNERDLSVDLQSNMVLDFNGSTFRHTTTSRPAYTMFSVLFCENVTLKNGTLIGDTLTHNYTASGGSHEFGFGIRIASSKNITVTNMDIYEMTGDSILIDGRGSYFDGSAGQIPDNIQILNSKLHDNRRQGLSVTGCRNLLVSGCEIYNIGKFRGTAPMAGIDLESDMGWEIDNSVIENNRFYNNANSAVALAWSGREDATARNTMIRNNDVDGVISLGYGENAIIRENRVKGGGIHLTDTHIPKNTLIEYNTLENAGIAVSDNAWVDIRHNTISGGQISMAVSGGVVYANSISNDAKGKTDYAIRINAKVHNGAGYHTIYCYQNVMRGTYQFPAAHFMSDNVKEEMPPANPNSHSPTPVPTPTPTPPPTPVPQDQVTAFVTRLYQTGLDRAPDSSGLDFWKKGLDSKTFSGAKAAENFLISQEIQNKGLSDSAYLDILYLALMNRQSDASGKAHWQGYLNEGASRTGILRQFLFSQEFQNICNTYGIIRGEPSVIEARDLNLDLTKFIHRQYKEILGRNGDVDGLNHWAMQIQQGSSPADVSRSFVFSEEFSKKNYGTDDFLKILYRAFMGRESDANGLSHWKTELQNGKSRQDIFASFVYSSEFQNIVSSFGI